MKVRKIFRRKCCHTHFDAESVHHILLSGKKVDMYFNFSFLKIKIYTKKESRRVKYSSDYFWRAHYQVILLFSMISLLVFSNFTELYMNVLFIQ